MPVENALTIDVEDWYHVCGVEECLPEENWPRLRSRVVENTRKILALLSLVKVKATFFVLGFIAERHPGLIEEIAGAGHEVASHGYSHRRVYSLSQDLFLQDLRRTTEILSRITGKAVRGYRAPEWSIRADSLWALDLLQSEGYEYDSSRAPLLVIGDQKTPRVPHRLDVEGGCLWEFPPLVGKTPLVNLPLGGGWGLRVFPYSWVRAAVRQLNERGQPAVLFFHPREFDAAGPRINLPWPRGFTLYARLERTGPRLNQLLREFRFTTLSAVLETFRERP